MYNQVTFITHKDITSSSAFSGINIDKTVNICMKKCRKYNHLAIGGLNDFFYVTELINEGLNDTRHGILRFYVMKSGASATKIVFKPKYSLLEFIINIGSIISVWFGISIAHIYSLIKPNTTVDKTNLLSLQKQMFHSLAALKMMRCFIRRQTNARSTHGSNSGPNQSLSLSLH